MTLAFLGEQPDDLVEAAHDAMSALWFPAFTLQLAGLGTFGGRRPDTLWAGLRDPTPVGALHARLLPALHGAGIVLDRRRFRPHVTLARFGRLPDDGPERLAQVMARWHGFLAPPFEVADYALWRSILTRRGAIHQELARYPLADGRGTRPDGR